MGKESSFRICIAVLLAIQAACWALTLLDLFSPGKSRALLRTVFDMVSRVTSRRSSGVLSYRDIRGLI
ncbi:hypothetical protein BKA66DRAFT_433801 [Pyrenochaeta sp. MPI-SDFR-AT-0127]|nr:hypothetical protein BKA66DRAFT_433801 [Pyrenochaeta sp. MPI-SDFR-AT-0127]